MFTWSLYFKIILLSIPWTPNWEQLFLLATRRCKQRNTLRCTIWLFDTLAYFKMITTVGLVNTSIISHNHPFFFLWHWEFKINSLREFPGDPAVKTLHFHCRGYEFDPWSLVWELRFHKQRGAAKKKKNNSLSIFQAYNTIWLTIIAMLHIRSPELVQLMAGSMYPLTSISQVLSSYNLVNAILLCFYDFSFLRICL